MKKEIAKNSDLTFITNEKGQNLKERFVEMVTKLFCNHLVLFDPVKCSKIREKGELFVRL